MKLLPILALLLAAGATASAFGAPQPAALPTGAPVAPVTGPLTGSGPTVAAPSTVPGVAPVNTPGASAVLGQMMGATPDPADPAAAAADDPDKKPDPCSATAPAAAQSVALPPDLGIFFDAGSATTNTDATTLVPKNPMPKTCEHGRVSMQVMMDQPFANRIGALLSIQVLIKADAGILIDFGSLRQNVLSFSGSDFQVVKDMDIELKAQPANKEKTVFIYKIVLPVQTFKTDKDIAFNLDLKYAVDVPPNTKQPNWKVLTTPDFVVTTSNTADNGNQLQEGNVDKATVRSPWAMWFLVPAAVFFIFWPSVKRFVFWLNRVRPGRKIPAEEVAWKVFRKVFNDAKDYGRMSPEFVKKIEAALRVYIVQESATLEEIKFRMKGNPQLDTIIRVIGNLQAVHWARTDRPFNLSERALDDLYADLKKIVPMPKNF
ncbi:MAG: hypothetical protein P4L53_22955 [Candidatus Obscuribacterales bacterium]|nr:hypothetical protein [Candidatus Obscuribacterales bacterium]